MSYSCIRLALFATAIYLPLFKPYPLNLNPSGFPIEIILYDKRHFQIV